VFPTPVNTSPSQPTLTSQERENYVQESLSSGSNCKLPCWWGITPGETTWDDAEQLLLYLGVRIGAVPGSDPETIWHGTGGFDFEGISINNSFGFVESDGVVDVILISSEGYNRPEEFQALWKNYSPKKILERYGAPDRVRLNVTEAYALGRGYHLWFFYDELGFMFRYPGDIIDAPVLRVCPVIERMRAIDLSLQAPTSSLSLERFDAVLEDIRLETETGKTRVLHSIQDATGLDEKEFYNMFMSEEQPTCFDTPQDIWSIK
jgi:hypothetical protein